MQIKPYNKYVIISRASDQLIHQWNLHIVPSKRAWKLAHQEVIPGMVMHGYQIIRVEEVIPKQFMNQHVSSDLIRFFANSNGDCPHCTGDLVNYICRDCDFDFRDIQKEECPFCGGTVLSDRCLSCHFDFDN